MTRLTSLVRGVEIGSNAFLLEVGGRRLLLDSGLHPKREGRDALPLFEATGGPELDAIFITHAHQDHVGSLPVAQRRFEEVPVFLTGPTADLSDAMLHNSVNVMTRRAEEEDIDGYPFFSHREIDRLQKRWQARGLGARWRLDGSRAGHDPGSEVVFSFHDAGHILGSAAVLIEEGPRRILYTGDVNFEDQSLSLGADLPTENIDTLIVETTRGDSPQPEGFTRRLEAERFAAAVTESFAPGGCTLVPVFALGKTQEILLLLHDLSREGKLPDKPVYIGGLSTKITMVHDRHADAWPRHHRGVSILEEVHPFTLDSREIFTTPVNKPRIYALSSGMMTENTVSNLFAGRILSDPKCSLFFVGYSDPESPAGRIRAAGSGGSASLGKGQASVEVRCQVREFNFSAHASRESIFDFAVRLAPRKLVLVHGDRPAVAWFQTALRKALPDTEVIVPNPGEPVDLG